MRSHERERLVERIDMGGITVDSDFFRQRIVGRIVGVLRIVCMSVFRWSTGSVFD